MENIKRHLEYKNDFIRFAKNEFNISTPFGLKKVDPFDFQISLLKTIENTNMNLIVSSRQMGITKLLELYIAWFVIFNKEKNIMIISNKSCLSQLLLKNVITILKNYSLKDCFDFDKEVNRSCKTVLELKNYNKIFAKPTSVDSLKGEVAHLLIIDNAAFIKNLKEILLAATPHFYATDSKLIIASTPYKNSHFNKMALLYEEDEEFKKNEKISLSYLPWKLHPNRDDLWFKKQCDMLNNVQEIIDEEYNCIVKTEEHEQKNRTISLRLTNKLLFEVIAKIGEEVSISDYIRNLINKDLES